MAEIRNHIDLDSFLADKLVEWFADPDESEAEQLRKACKLMTNFISNRPSSEIISASSPSGAVAQFKYALDDSVAWSKVESELNDMPQSDLDGYQFPDLVHYLTLI
ncbi:hypothetical protein FQY83_13850 [Luteimonas marina]|uniref:Uncharacterized protein n=1 Tax=Luteimonas marina TaxID=488485 RepID=A0A5C5U0K1_9GAMM|nr:hypothetical protein [Luteimonas marina]TWT19424.1 hypothetical protein FQY83_13850 [Luteimonas marina]